MAEEHGGVEALLDSLTIVPLTFAWRFFICVIKAFTCVLRPEFSFLSGYWHLSILYSYSKDRERKTCLQCANMRRILRTFSIKVAHKPIRTISNILKKPKDKIGKEDNRGIVYQIRCKSCDSVYVGQTPRALKTRVKEHAKAIATLDENSLLAKHHVLHNHKIDLENVEIVDRSPTWRQRLFLAQEMPFRAR